MRARMLSLAAVLLSCWLVAADATAAPPLPIRSMADVNAALKVAKQSRKMLVIEFIGSKWCPFCKQLEANILSDELFRTTAQQRFVIAIADFPPPYDRTPDKVQADAALSALMDVKKHFEVPTFPTLISFKPDGQVLNKVVGHGEDRPDAYLALLTKTS